MTAPPGADDHGEPYPISGSEEWERPQRIVRFGDRRRVSRIHEARTNEANRDTKTERKSRVRSAIVLELYLV